MFAARITLAHLSISTFNCVENSSGFVPNDFEAEWHHALPDVRQLDDALDCSVEQSDDFLGTAGRKEDADPSVPFQVGMARFRGGGHIRKHRRASLARNRNRTQLAALDVRRSRGQGRERDRHVSGDDCADRRSGAGVGYVREVERAATCGATHQGDATACPHPRRCNCICRDWRGSALPVRRGYSRALMD